jgi:hypothetical protein
MFFDLGSHYTKLQVNKEGICAVRHLNAMMKLVS